MNLVYRYFLYEAKDYFRIIKDLTAIRYKFRISNKREVDLTKETIREFAPIKFSNFLNDLDKCNIKYQTSNKILRFDTEEDAILAIKRLMYYIDKTKNVEYKNDSFYEFLRDYYKRYLYDDLMQIERTTEIINPAISTHFTGFVRGRVSAYSSTRAMIESLRK